MSKSAFYAMIASAVFSMPAAWADEQPVDDTTTDALLTAELDGSGSSEADATQFLPSAGLTEARDAIHAAADQRSRIALSPDDHEAAVSAEVIEAAIRASLSREHVEVDSDERYDTDAIHSIAQSIALVCEDRACVLDALASGYQETRWRPHERGPSGECGWAQQAPEYATQLPELERMARRERCYILQFDYLTSVRQYHVVREYWRRYKGDRWPCYYNAGYICTDRGQAYLSSWRRFRAVYERLLEEQSVVAEALN